MAQEAGYRTGGRVWIVPLAVVLVPGCLVLGARRFDVATPGVDVVAVAANTGPVGGVRMGFVADAGGANHPDIGLSKLVADNGLASAGADVRTSEVRLDASAAGQTVLLQVGQQLVVTLGTGWSTPRANMPAADAGSAIQPLRTDTAAVPPHASSPSTVFTALRVGQAVVVAQSAAGSKFAISVVVQPGPGQQAGPLPKSPSP